MAKPRTASKAPRKPSTGKREVIDTGRNKMYGRRNAAGQFTEMDDVGRSLASDRRRKAKNAAKPGQRDRGDRKAASGRR